MKKFLIVIIYDTQEVVKYSCEFWSIDECLNFMNHQKDWTEKVNEIIVKEI